MIPYTVYKNVPAPGCTQKPLSVATPDGGLLYTGFKSINYIEAPEAETEEKDSDMFLEPNAVDVKTMSTRIAVNALDVSPLWGKKQPAKNDGGSSDKQFAIVAEDLSVQVWDFQLGEAVIGHKAHQHQHEARLHPLINVLLSYISNGNILSIDAQDLVIYCVASNTYCRRPTFLSPRNHQLTVLRCSPYTEQLFAVGTAGGLVLVCDMRRMTIVYKFSGQVNVKICDLAWREMSWQREEINASNAEQLRKSTAAVASAPARAETPTKIAPVKAPLIKSKATEDDDLFDIYNFDHLESEFGAPASISCKSLEDGEFVGLEKPANNVVLDYIEACESMKADLIAQSSEKPDQVEVTLADCQTTESRPSVSDASNSNQSQKDSVTLGSNDSTEGSLEVIQFSSSSDDAVIVDGEASKPKREVLHHIYHQAEVHDAPESPQLLSDTKQSETLTKEASFTNVSLGSQDSPLRADILLVSINDDDIIMIWNTVTGGHCGKNYNKGNLTSKAKEIHWLNDHTIVSMSRQQLVFWSLDYDLKMHRYKIQKDKVHKCSVQDIVTFAPSPVKRQQIWLILRSHRVGIMHPRTGKMTAEYGCLAFGVRAIADCPMARSTIALGCSDKRLAIYDISRVSGRRLPIKSVHVNSVVYSLAWSPDCSRIAFGTYDGTVGILDVETMRVRKPFHAVHKKEVYSLVWEKSYIYFIVNRMLGVYHANHPNTPEAVLLPYVERPSYLAVHGEFLLIGTEDGFLELFQKLPHQELGYLHLKQSSLLSRYITDIAFNPNDSNQFAVVGHDTLLHLMELEPEQRSWSKLHTFRASDPRASIASVKWSNYSSHLLLSFHIEGKVCLWNTKEVEQPPLTITYHCPMWCGMFLPTDENIIMCAGKVLSLELIDIQDALKHNEKNICSKLDTLLKVKWASKSLTQNAPVLNAAQKKRNRRDERNMRRQNQSDVTTSQYNVQQQAKEQPIESMMGALNLETKGTESPPAVECSKCKEREMNPMPNNFLAHSRTCLCLAQKELNRNALEKLAIVLTEDPAKIDKSVLMSKLFSTKVMAKDLIATELTNLKQSNNKDIAPLCLTVTTFKLRDELQEHIDNKTLNEWHVSVAPAVSYVFWQKCCKAYASQMEENGYILHATTYLVAIDLQSEAIEMLLKYEYFREALAMARIHLPATDPIIKTIINKWLEQLEKTGNFAAAALICVLDNEMLRGYTYLRKFRIYTPEIADLMKQIKRIGQLGALFDEDDAQQTVENGKKKDEE